MSTRCFFLGGKAAGS